MSAAVPGSEVSGPGRPPDADPPPLTPKRRSIPSWLLPPPIRRLNKRLWEIRQLLHTLSTQVAEVETLTQRQADELSRIAGQIDDLAGDSPGTRITGPADGAQAKASRRRRPQPDPRGAGAIVLAYHSIAEPTTDPHDIVVPPDQFERHLQILSTMGPSLPLSELSQHIRTGTLTDLSFAITFDDGYANNLHTAKPILERYGVPATVFIATEPLGGTPFWHDELAALILADETPRGSVTLEVNGDAYSWDLEGQDRERIHHQLWERLRILDDRERRQALEALRAQLGQRHRIIDCSLTQEELGELTRGGLIDIGAHTRTHPVLTQVTAEAARDEICGSKAGLEAYLGRPISAFAYPYGEYSTREVALVREAGFEIAFTTRRQFVTAECDVLQVPRVGWEDVEEALTRGVRTSRGATTRTAVAPVAGKLNLGHPGHPTVRVFQSLWVGPGLSPLEHLCIKSFLAHDHKFVLYAYEEVDNVPAGCVVEDASAILPKESVFLLKSGLHVGSASTFSDRFRYQLLQTRGGWWVDTDTLCLTREIPDTPYVFTSLPPEGLYTGGILKAPPDSALLTQALARSAQVDGDFAHLAIGPRLVDTLVRELGLEHLAWKPEDLYPLGWDRALEFFDPARADAIAAEVASSSFVHFFSQMLRVANVLKDIRPPESSYLDRMYEAYDVAFPTSRRYEWKDLEPQYVLEKDYWLVCEEVERLQSEVQELRSPSSRHR